MARTWVVGEGDLGADLRATMEASSFSGEHPASLGQRVSYWLVHRTTSPWVLGPLAGIVLVVVGVGARLLASGGRNRYADFDDEDDD